jgi:CubicO group peptidase (beta-lactamase class C family)
MSKILTLSCVVAALFASEFASAAPLASRLTTILTAAEKEGFSGVVLAGSPTEVLYEKAMGQADRARRSPHSPDMPWRWASVSKQVTAVIAAQLVAEGKLGLDRSIATYLPQKDFSAPQFKDITIRHLLQHTSGLANPSDLPADVPKDEVPPFYLADVMPDTQHKAAANGACGATPKRAAGEQFEYNNCDTLVLAAVLERVTGQLFATLLAERIAKPLNFAKPGLAGLRMATTKDKYAQPVKGYEDGKRLERAFNLASYGAAGAMLGTPRELLLLDQALLRGELLPADQRAAVWKGEAKYGYAGLGVWVFPATLKGCKEPVELIERRGAIGGVQVRNFLAPSRGRALVVFTNRGDWEFGEVWQGKGMSYEVLSAVMCE